LCKRCPRCKKRSKPREGKFICDVHGEIEPEYSYLVTSIIDDSTETIRTVCFRETANKFLKTDNDKMNEIRLNPDSFSEFKEEIVGRQVIIKGRIRKNKMFDRLEMIPEEFIEPDPAQEIKRLKDKEDEVSQPS
jgi:hypothetical protein